MLNIFKQVVKNVDSTKIVDKKSTKELIEEIHETFYTEVDRLLESAKLKESEESNIPEITDKGKRLSALGFVKTQIHQEYQNETNRLNIAKNNNKIKDEIIEAINYFTQNYPQYKFITEESVKKICERYGLIYSTVDRYKGDVPEKNLQEIENFSIKEKDTLYYFRIFSSPFSNSITITGTEEELNFQYRTYKNSSRYISEVNKCLLEIAAPPSDFDTKGLEIKNFKLQEIPDPIVLHPVTYKNKKYYLIVTAWGLEASDELVINQKMN